MTGEHASTSGPSVSSPPEHGEQSRISPAIERGNRLVGALLAINLGLLLFALSFSNATAEGPAKRSLSRSIAILTEIDAYLDDNIEQLQQAAQAEDGPLSLPDFPIELELTAEEIGSADRGEIRNLLLSRSAERVYDEGMSAFQTDEQGIGIFSPQGAVRTGMNLFRTTPHNIMAVLTILLAVVAAGLVVRLAVVSRGYGRLVALGASICLAAIPFLILAIALRFALRLAADGTDEFLAREFLELGQELSWAPHPQRDHLQRRRRCRPRVRRSARPLERPSPASLALPRGASAGACALSPVLWADHQNRRDAAPNHLCRDATL